MIDSSRDSRTKEIRLSIASISCVACTPAFKRGLENVDGIENVRRLPMLNKVIVDYDPERSNEAQVKSEILKVAEKAGLKGKVFISK